MSDHHFLRDGGEMGERMRTFAWEHSRLGPPANWPDSLKIAVQIALNSRYPMWLGWGPDLLMLYNDDYAPLLGARHPAALGEAAPEVWSDIWADLQGQAEQVFRGEATWNEQVLLTMERHGYTEETYFTWSFSPLPGEHGEPAGGLFCVCTEETSRVVAARRLRLVRHLSGAGLEARSMGNACELLARTLSGHRIDVPFALIYLLDTGHDRVSLVGGTADLQSYPASAELSDPRLPWPMAAALREGLQLSEPVRPEASYWPEAVRSVATLPIARTGSQRPTGFLVVGLTPRLPFDGPYRDFLGLLSDTLATTFDRARGFEQERVRVAAIAELDRARTTLGERTQQESERMFRETADTAPTVLWTTDADGRCVYLSRAWFELTGQAEDAGLGKGWLEMVHPADRPGVAAAYAQAQRDHGALHVDYRVQTARSGYRWVVGSGRPRFSPTGEFGGYIGSVMDIHDRKRAEADLREARNRLEGILTAAEIGTWSWYPKQDRVVGDRNLARLFGMLSGLENGLERDAFTSAIHPDDRPRMERAVERALQSGIYEDEYRVTGAEGQFRWIEARARARDGDRDVFDGVVLDITERVEATAALRESERRLQLAISIAEMGTFDIDLRTDAVQVNEPGRAIYGWPPEQQLTFSAVKQQFHPDDREWVEEVVARALQPDGSREFDLEQRILRTDGELRWIRVRGRAVFNDGPVALRCIGTYLDITDRKLSEEHRDDILAAEREARRQAERVNRMKDEFLATLSHELRTPLNSILGWSQLLLRGCEPEDARQGLETIERNARAQTQMIEDLLDMSRIISGKVRLHVEVVDLAEIVGSAIETVQPSVEAKKIRLTSALDAGAGLVSGDPNRLQQVVWNLLSNAVKFTPAGGKLRVGLQRVASEVEISVSDSGAGIAPEFLPQVFDRFRQADSSTTRHHGGLGLGLSIVKQLVELHGGTVRAQSPGLGLGATFVVSLPVTGIARQDSGEWSAVTHRRGGADGHAPDNAPELAGKRILVVDDDRDAREVVKRILQGCGAEVSTAGSVAEAILALRREEPDMLISDLGMPGQDGYDLIREVRSWSEEAGGKLPAVALTAFARSEDRQRVLKAGYQMHLAKPVEAAELITTCAELLRGSAET
jgi:PAS domain S-box-containing protein